MNRRHEMAWPGLTCHVIGVLQSPRASQCDHVINATFYALALDRYILIELRCMMCDAHIHGWLAIRIH